MQTPMTRVYGYRWIVLIVFAVISAVVQMQWLTFAPIAREARIFYGATPLQIDFLSMLFMIVFLVVCMPASYIIDTYGIRIGIGIGAVLTGVFGLFKGVFADQYSTVMVAQIGLAVAQPFILNAGTKLAMRWFPVHERATAVGIATLAQFVGIIGVMVATPLLIAGGGGEGERIPFMLQIYGAVSVVGAVALLAFLRERPPTPPTARGGEGRVRMIEGVGLMFKNRNMRLLVLLFFIGLGMFNAISTCIDQICQIKGLTMEQTGLVGGLILIAGVVGAVILPPLSDRARKRKAYLVLGMACMIPGLMGLTFLTSYVGLLVSAFVFGFFFLGAGGPVGFQYGAEISFPAPESTSQGLLTLAGQISGILFIVGMNVVGMIPFMVLFVAMALVNIYLCLRLDESPMIMGDAIEK
ncbi:MAG: MFS transporter [Desulfobacterales bacterium]|nr:MFS transporter [Desulfobacterales bacterium]